MKISTKKKEDQTVGFTSATIKVITEEQIREYGYLTLEDVLMDLPGIQFRNISGLNSYSFLRGLPRQNNTILVLIDGICINELNSGGYYGGGQYNLGNVERIEVQYGPSSVLYGTNAISGLVNIITKTPGDEGALDLNMGMGNFSTYFCDMHYSYKGEKADVRLSGMYKTSNKADLSGDNNDGLWDDYLEIFEKDYAFDAKVKSGDFIFGANIQNRQSSTSTYYPSIGTIHKGYGTLWNLLFANAYIKHRKQFGENTILHTTLYNRNTTVLGNSVKEVTDTGCIAYYRPNNHVGIESVIEYKVADKMDMLYGVFAYYEVLSDGYSNTSSSEYFIRPGKPSSPDFLNNAIAGVFIEYNARIRKKWQLSPAIRYEYGTSYKDVFTPNIALLYNNGRLNTKFMIAKAFRAPRPWDYTDGEGNPDLQPEYLNSLELSTTYYLTKYIKFDLALYNNTLTNGLIKEYSIDNSTYKWANTEAILTKGLELSLLYKQRDFSIRGFYTFLDSRDEDGQFIEEIAPHSASLGLDYKVSKILHVGFKTYYFGKRKNPTYIEASQSSFIDPAIVSNAYLSFLDIKDMDIQLICKNITNAEYYHTSNLIPDRFRQPQFSFILKFLYRLGKDYEEK